MLLAALAEIERQRLIIAGLQRNRFGRRSERLDDATVQQGVEDLEQSVAEQSAAVEAAVSSAEQPATELRAPRRAARRAGQTQSRRAAGGTAAGRASDRCRGQDLPVLRRHAASDRRRQGRDAGLRPRATSGSG